MKPDVILLEPPVYDCRAPHSGCALLTTALKHYDYQVAYRDLNLESILWLLDPQRISHALEIAGHRLNTLLTRARKIQGSGGILPIEERHALWRSLKAMQYGNSDPGFALNAVEHLQRSETFFDSATHRAARATIDAALDLQAFVCDPRLSMGLCPQNYNGPYRATSLDDLLAASLDTAGNPFFSFYDQEIMPWASSVQPIIVGISISNVFQVIPGVTLSRLLHDHGLFVVIGGPFFSKFSSQIAQKPAFFDLCDAVVIGEGEETLLQLVYVRSRKDLLSSVSNIIFRQNGSVVVTHERYSRQLPDYGPADFRTLQLDNFFTPFPVLPIHAGKGCEWSKCTFCEIPQINHDFNQFRRNRKPEDIVREMQVQMQRHEARHFIFTDESLPLPLLSDTADEIIRQKLDVNYIGYTRFSSGFDKGFCAKLAMSGCRKLMFGLESGSADVNKRCRKGVDLNQVPRIIDACQKSGIAVHIFSIVGLPGENNHESEKSAEYLLQLSRVLELPVSTIDVSAFYLNWNSWLRRNAGNEKIQYHTDQDFPLHVDNYTFQDGMGNRISNEKSAQIYSQLCWESSELGFDIGYFNPVWPAWEEYTLLYLSKFRNRTGDPRIIWPANRQEILEKKVRVADGITALEIPFSLASLAKGMCKGGSKTLALSPSSQIIEIDQAALRTITAKPGHTVSELLNDLGHSSQSREITRECYADIIQWIKAGVLQW